MQVLSYLNILQFFLLALILCVGEGEFYQIAPRGDKGYF